MIKISKELYDRQTLLKAAYAFTDEIYFHLDADEDYYYAYMRPKQGKDDKEIEARFENELLSQQTRRIISESTKSIREMIIARALSSTVIDLADMEESEEQKYSADKILEDWFQRNE